MESSILPFLFIYFFQAKGCYFQLFQTKNNITTQEVITQPHGNKQKIQTVVSDSATRYLPTRQLHSHRPL